MRVERTALPPVLLSKQEDLKCRKTVRNFFVWVAHATPVRVGPRVLVLVSCKNSLRESPRSRDAIAKTRDACATRAVAMTRARETPSRSLLSRSRRRSATRKIHRLHPRRPRSHRSGAGTSEHTLRSARSGWSDSNFHQARRRQPDVYVQRRRRIVRHLSRSIRKRRKNRASGLFARPQPARYRQRAPE